MKNVKLEIRKLSKAGFSLVEMLVVIAVIGVIAAIAIPNIGSVNDSANAATAQRNAQSLASMASAAIAAGYDFGSAATTSSVVTSLTDGSVSPLKGAFSGKVFQVPNIPASGDAAGQRDKIETYLSWDGTNGMLLYNPAP